MDVMIPQIAYYISSHGYGHAARQQAVITALAKQGAQVHVRAAAPAKFFKRAVSHHAQRYDIGMKQRDALHFDIPASLDWYADFLQQQPSIIEQERAFIQQQNIRLIVSDMPPIAFEIAAVADIPSVAVTHFTWDWVYAHYMDDYPQYRYIVDTIRASYNKATLALQMQLPLPHEFDMFPIVEPLPLVYNTPSETRAEIWEKFAIPDDYRVALLSMGGHEWGASNIRALKALDGWVFLVMPSAWDQVKDMPERFRCVPMAYDDYHNLIAAADVVIGKAGGSTVAEVLGHQTPMLYTTQKQWREATLLDKTLREYAASHYVEIENFMAGAWIEQLEPFMAQNHTWAEIERNGAQSAANRLLQLL